MNGAFICIALWAAIYGALGVALKRANDPSAMIPVAFAGALLLVGLIIFVL